ncbi:clavesin-1-like [Cimex lectularius]|uniref:CRAL-TRIO domain-containing protein n=1 Tax=Cimex lectularius TaxID=79782 RepID=A0A8I6TFY6_CIMLE|nr:clavesin-1-like [Cimex lectularius]
MEIDKRVRCGEHILRFEDEADPGEWFLEKSRIELRETPEIREKAMEEFRKKITEMDNIVFPIDDETSVLSFLRACKFYPDSAFDKLIKFFNFRAKNPKYCENLSAVKDVNVFKHSIFTIMPYRDQHGRRILLVEIGKKWNTKEVSLVEIIRGVMLVVSAALIEPKTQIAGANVIIDLEGLSLSHVWQFSPGFAKMLLEWVQEALPCRIKSVHIVNQPYIFNMLFSIFKPFINEKLRNRIYFHGDNKTSLIEHIDAKFVPTQYGGDMVLETNYGMEIHKLLYQYEWKIQEANTYRIINDKKQSKK